jgi:NADP-dependent 3-hydroxy acid dehydrogenase YdfG
MAGMSLDSLKGRVALVTGASSGIGEATARLLSAHGVRVAAVARRLERLEALARAAGPGRVAVAVADVAEEQGARAAVAFAVREYGRLDILVNNAGVMLLGPIEGADAEDWRRMVGLNLLGLMFVTREALPHLVAAQGDVVNVSSVAGRVARKGAGGYNATKWGVCAFSESLRQEMSPKGVRVTVVEPGLVATELADHITHAETRRATQEWIGSLRPLRAEDVAAAVLYAVSQPPHVSVNEILLRPTDQAYP